MSDGAARLENGWHARHRDQVATPEAAIARIKPGQRVFIGTGCAQPGSLVRALAAQARRLTDVEIVQLLTFGDAPYTRDDVVRSFRINTFFIVDNVRGVVQRGLGDYTPIFLSDIPRLLCSGRLPLDAALIQVSPPDANDMCSLGISVDIVGCAIKNASLVIAQVNPRMPRTMGDSSVPRSDLDILVPADEPLVEAVWPEATEVTRRIAAYVAGLVEDGATLELGLGRIPLEVPRYLTDRKDLGMHTEVITDSVIDLIEAGCLTGARKTIDRGKVVTSFCLGTRRLYDYIDENPAFAFHPTEYVNDPDVIGRQRGMTSVNVALEVDLTGQACADSVGGTFYSGIGGQADFIRGAARAPGGKSIIALPSTTTDGSRSRIVTQMSAGAGVVTTRGDVQYVVTEYGVAYLHGKSVQERALALISIAHPDFRARLLREAVEARYVRPELADIEGRILVGSQDLRAALVLDDGTRIGFRRVHPTDEPRVRALFYQLSPETLYRRFMARVGTVPPKQIQDFVFIDHRNVVAIVGTLPEAHGEEILAVGGYYLDPDTNQAEVALVVSDPWQGRGIGSFLLAELVTIARRNGIRGFTAEVLVSNLAMQAVLYGSGLEVTRRLEGDVYCFELNFG